MKLSRIVILLILMALTASTYADNRQARKFVRKGNTLYRKDKKQEAQVNYLKAYRADSTDARVVYNLTTSMFPRDNNFAKCVPTSPAPTITTRIS